METLFKTPHFETLDDLLHETYKHIIDNGSKVIGKRGGILEVNNFVATLINSRARTSLSLDRRLVRSKFAEFAWYLSADSSREFIIPYISAYNDEESENEKILGAYGPKIFGKRHKGKSQFDRIFEQLKLRPDTKQAYISISDITDYKVQGEVHSSPPCTIGLHFLYRDNALNLTVYMRSNDAYLGLPHDLFCFSMLQEMVSVKLGMRLGKYTHICTSLHVYDKHLERVNRYLQEGLFEQLPMPVMSEFDDRILQYIVEAYQNKDGIIELNTDEHPSYWHDFALFSNKYFSKNSPEDWLSLFRTEELKKIAINSVTT